MPAAKPLEKTCVISESIIIARVPRTAWWFAKLRPSAVATTCSAQEVALGAQPAVDCPALLPQVRPVAAYQ